MVWEDPTARTIADQNDLHVWLSIKEEWGFVLQQFQTHLDSTHEFAAHVGAFKFRILLRTAHVNILVAKETDFLKICEHWEWLDTELFPQLRLLDDSPAEEIFQYSILKLTSIYKHSGSSPASVKKTNQLPQEVYAQAFPGGKLIESKFDFQHWIGLESSFGCKFSKSKFQTRIVELMRSDLRL